MPVNRKTPPALDPEKQAQILAQLRRDRELRETGYRERALKLLPHVCAHCGREFEGKRLRELTVHHKDHNWKNNPPDGSNWELLCLYCHDYEHEKSLVAQHRDKPTPEDDRPAPSIFTPFEGLVALLKANDEGPNPPTEKRP